MKKQTQKPIDKEKLEIRENFQAVLLADTYVTRLAPITKEIPKCLLPVGNVPLIEHTMNWLEANKIYELLVVYTSHSQKIEQYFSQRDKCNMKIQLIHAHDAKTVGDALRELQYKGVVYGDFLLCYGDMVSNIKLQSAIKHFLWKKKENSLNIMTAVLKKTHPFDSNRTYQDDDFAFVIEKQSGDILQIENINKEDYFELNLERLKVSKGAALGQKIHYNYLDNQIYICSLDVLKAFQENFTFNSFREDFMKELLTAEINEEKISSYIVSDSEYSLRASDPRLYYKINQSVIKRYTYPFTVNKMMAYQKQNVLNQDFNIFMGKTTKIAHSTVIGNNSCIGDATQIGENTNVQASVVGKNCNIGSKVQIQRCIIQDNVIIEDGSIVKDSIICSNAVVKKNCIIKEGSILSYNVITKPDTTLPEYTMATTFEYDKDLIEENQDESSKLFEKGFLYTAQLFVQNEAMLGYNQHEIIQNYEDVDDLVHEEKEGSEEDIGQREDAIFQSLAEDIRQIVQEALNDPPKTDHSTVEIHNLKVAENIEGWRCIQVFVPEILNGLIVKFKESANPQERISHIKTLLGNWNKLFRKFVHSDEDSLIFISEIEQFCIAHKDFYDFLHIFLQLLFQNEILTKEYILNWVNDRRNQSTDDQKHFLDLCKDFIEWLESDDDDEEEEEEEDPDGEDNEDDN
ncbi:hypothetical protein ABPG74_013759 [Tetrahymena malaccensis]